ncbi:MAG: V-type ATP synthase subunit D [Elusimicrobia bacterium]|nr:V-type ATP synthase subunit D [Elusimicrobiota bacterium]
MSHIRANPNRMELMLLGKRLALAQRGYRLLKDKQDELMDSFRESVLESRQIREKLEKGYASLRELYISSFSSSYRPALRSYSLRPPVLMKLAVSHIRLMNLKMPEIKAEFEDNSADLGSANISPSMPEFLKEFAKIVSLTLDLANSERRMYMVAEELQKVRRRVNALEHIFIPELQETIFYISMQLEEMERETITRLMKVKDIVRRSK